MKTPFFFTLFTSSLIIFHPLLFSSGSSCTPQFNNELLLELKLMCEKDQEARFQVINSENSNEFHTNLIIEQIDQANLPHLKEIIHQFGWPGFKMVGEEGADIIWLLIQHCDQDIEFQKSCLHLLEGAVARNDAPKRHLAYLRDRVLINEEKEQIYGTQLQIIDGKIIVFPIEEPEGLDKRREEMDLCPFAEYLSLVKEVYHVK